MARAGFRVWQAPPAAITTASQTPSIWWPPTEGLPRELVEMNVCAEYPGGDLSDYLGGATVQVYRSSDGYSNPIGFHSQSLKPDGDQWQGSSRLEAHEGLLAVFSFPQFTPPSNDPVFLVDLPAPNVGTIYCYASFRYYLLAEE